MWLLLILGVLEIHQFLVVSQIHQIITVIVLTIVDFFLLIVIVLLGTDLGSHVAIVETFAI